MADNRGYRPLDLLSATKRVFGDNRGMSLRQAEKLLRRHHAQPGNRAADVEDKLKEVLSSSNLPM